jgi:hypothetical protein
MMSSVTFTAFVPVAAVAYIYALGVQLTVFLYTYLYATDGEQLLKYVAESVCVRVCVI